MTSSPAAVPDPPALDDGAGPGRPGPVGMGGDGSAVGDTDLAARLRTGIWVLAAVIAVFVLHDLLAPHPSAPLAALGAVKFLEAAVLAWGWRRIGTARTPAALERVGVLFVSLVYVGSIFSGWLRGDITPTLLLLVACTIGTASLVPWSWRSQALTALAACVVLLPNPFTLLGVEEAAEGGSRLTLTVGSLVAFSGSVYLALEHQLQRRAQARMAVLLDGHRRSLERIARGDPLPAVLDEVCGLIEGQSTGIRCSVLLLEGNRLRHVSAPGLPADYNQAIDGIEIGPAVGSCGTAAFTRRAVVVEDIASDPLWVHFRDLADQHGLRSCTSTPILTGDGVCLGTFAAYHRRPYRPSPRDWHVLGVATSIARLAIERTRNQEELLRSRSRIEDESHVSRALARVGSRMISTLSTNAVLHQLCQLTTEELGCDCADTILPDPTSTHFRTASMYGYPETIQDELASLVIPAATLEQLLELIDDATSAQVRTTGVTDPDGAAILDRFGIRRALYVPIRRGPELIGILAANRRHSDHPFDERERRIAEGIAQIASMALQNARLVERLEAADRVKSEFVSTMSHELRTPVSVIIGYTEMLRDQHPEAQRQRLLGRIHEASLELLEMIQATLDLNRLEAGQDAAVWEPVRIDDLFDELATGYAALPRPVGPAGPALRWRHEPGLTLVSDRRKLRTILKNLVGNALKFTRSGSIEIDARRQGNEVSFSIRDTGVGIAADHLPLIFEMFRQADSSDSRSYGGVGLGLYIVRRLVTQLRGEVLVESRVGHGSTFTVRLPVAPAPELRAAPGSPAAGLAAGPAAGAASANGGTGARMPGSPSRVPLLPVT